MKIYSSVNNIYNINDIYQYYYYGGFNTIIANDIVNLCICYLLLFIFNLLTNCIDYKGLLYENNGIVYIGSYINIKHWFPSDIYLIICF